MMITDAAVFYSRLTKWDEHFEGLPVHTISSQLYYDLSFEYRGLPEFGSHLTVDISGELDRKIESILCYQTQFPPEKRRVIERVRGLASAAGTAAGFQAGEVLTTAKPLGCRDLVRTLVPS